MPNINGESIDEGSYLLDEYLDENSTVLQKVKVYAKRYSFVASYLSLCLITFIALLVLIAFIQILKVKSDVSPLIDEFKDVNMNDVYNKLEDMADQKIGQFVPFIIESYNDIKKCVCPHSSVQFNASKWIDVSYECPHPSIKLNSMESVYCKN